MAFKQACARLAYASTLRNLPKNGCSTVTRSSPTLSSLANKQLNITPLEAKLTALSLSAPSNTSTQSSVLRLPSIDISHSIVFENPSLKPAIKEMPSILDILEKFDPAPSVAIEEPDKVVRKEAARMVVIRKRKMKKHKLRKLRKRMKFVWEKFRQKREYKKEKDFQAGQMQLIREAQAFNAKDYVHDVIVKTKEEPFPTRWKGKKLPKFVIENIIANQGKYIRPKE